MPIVLGHEKGPEGGLVIGRNRWPRNPLSRNLMQRDQRLASRNAEPAQYLSRKNHGWDYALAASPSHSKQSSRDDVRDCADSVHPGLRPELAARSFVVRTLAK